MIKSTKDHRRGQADLFLESATATAVGGAFYFRGRRYRIKGVPKRAPQQQIHVTFDRIDPSRMSVWCAAGKYLGTAIS